jgi:hypothetical protein
MLTIAPDTRACVINLPCPEQTHELAHLLKRRCSTREFLPDMLPAQRPQPTTGARSICMR